MQLYGPLFDFVGVVGFLVWVATNGAPPPSLPAIAGLAMLGTFFGAVTTAEEIGVDEARFWAQVDQGVGPDECWLWTGSRDVQGYGRLPFRGPWDYAHRVAWMLTHGGPEPGIQLVSSCGNRACVRPDHRIPSTAAAAGRYKAEHGLVARGERHPSRVHPERWARGERHGSARLSDQQVAEIRTRYAAGDAPVRQLACEHGVSISQIRRIVTGRNRW